MSWYLRVVHQAEIIPRGYGLVYIRYWSGDALYAPIPLNWIFRAALSTYVFAKTLQPSWWQDELAKAYQRGRRDAAKEGPLTRFAGLIDALDESYTDDVIIRCEVTAGDIRALRSELGGTP